MKYKNLRNKEFCENLYIKENKTIRQIALIVGCTSPCVRCWLHKHKVKMRKAAQIPPNYQNKRFGSLVAISYNKNYTWNCKCDCGNTLTVYTAHLKKGAKSCWSCRNKYLREIKWCGHGEICLELWTSIKRSAKNRKMDFDISIEDIWGLFLKQNRKCALSGVDLFFSRSVKARPSSTASLDRIDSKKGYTLDNIQWVHKDINRMKNKYDQEVFIQYCKLIAEKHKE